MEIVKPRLDIVFKRLFSDENNKDLLTDFVACMLEIPIEDIQHIKVLNPELPPEYENQKFVHLDLSMEINNSMANVEMQSYNDKSYLDRALYYWAKLYASTLKSGNDYEEAKKCHMINILGFNVFDCADYHSQFATLEVTRHVPLNDKMDIHFFELPKVNELHRISEPQQAWLKFLSAETEEGLNMVKDTNEAINKAVQVIYDYSADTKMREAVRMREKRLHDECSALAFAEKKGRAAGRAEGRAAGRAAGIAEERKRMEQLLRNMGMSDENIKAFYAGELTLATNDNSDSEEDGFDFEE